MNDETMALIKIISTGLYFLIAIAVGVGLLVFGEQLHFDQVEEIPKISPIQLAEEQAESLQVTLDNDSIYKPYMYFRIRIGADENAGFTCPDCEAVLKPLQQSGDEVICEWCGCKNFLWLDTLIYRPKEKTEKWERRR